MGHSTELNKGERRKEGLINDYKIIQEIMESKDITWEDTGVIYTDGSKKKNTGKSMGQHLSLKKRIRIFI